MGNADTKLKNNEIVYAKMTRTQYDEFIKFLKYKKSYLKKKQDHIALENIVQQSIEYKKEIDRESEQKKKIKKKIKNEKGVQKETIDNNYINKIEITNKITDNKANIPNRMFGQLQSKQAKSNFNDYYENIFQERQRDMNNSYFKALEKHGDLDKSKNEFMIKQELVDKLKKEKNLEYINKLSTPNHTQKNDHKPRYKDFKSQLDNFSKNINPYKLLGVDKTTEIAIIKKKYKKLALKFHPDRKTGNSDVFQAITKAYLSIVEDKEKLEEKSFNELKSGIKNTKYESNAPLGKGDKFNSQLFHEIYENNSLPDDNSKGYGEWMKENTNSNKKNSEKIFTDKFNINIFNTIFEKEKPMKSNNQIIKSNIPEAIQPGENINFTELGVDYQNYSKHTGNLKYTDYKEAMTNTHLVSEYNQNKKYTNLKELKKEREKIELNENEIREYEMFKLQNKEKEDRRIKKLQKHDIDISHHFSKVNNILKSSDKKLRISHK